MEHLETFDLGSAELMIRERDDFFYLKSFRYFEVAIMDCLCFTTGTKVNDSIKVIKESKSLEMEL